MKKVLFSAAVAVSLLVSGCATHIGQEFAIAGKLNSLKSDPKAKQYLAVTKRAEKAYVSGDNKRALKLIDIVNKKVARGSTY